jgi:hypothetical protein
MGGKVCVQILLPEHTKSMCLSFLVYKTSIASECPSEVLVKVKLNNTLLNGVSNILRALISVMTSSVKS